MNIDLQFWNQEQERFFWSKLRNNEFDGAFANGKSYSGCQRAFVHLMTFPKYAMTICRQTFKVLKSTTMKTFFKICPEELIYSHNAMDGYTVLINGSFIYWMHLDNCDEQDLRGLEINSALIDQAEEISEPIYNVLDSRIGRWDQAKVADHLLVQLLDHFDFESYSKLLVDNPKEAPKFLHLRSKWPKHPKSGRFLVNNYMDVLCNVADDEEFHWTYRYYNPTSSERKPDHFYIHRETDQSMDDPKTYQQKLLRDQEWVDKYVKGLRGKSSATIHHLDKLSIINPDDYKKEEFEEFLQTLFKRGALYRILDHGDTGVTACGWLAILNGQHIFYREYYAERKLISQNRKTIQEYSFQEEYIDNLADPAIFKKTMQSVSGTKAGFYTTAMEYEDTDSITDEDAPPISWTAADNNEFTTRNRISELLVLHPKWMHPITKISPAPGLYFIQKSTTYPLGVWEGIKQLRLQRRQLLGEDNGKKIYSEERDMSIPDHAYDYIRYGVAAHNSNKTLPRKKPSQNCFAYYQEVLKRRPKIMPASY